MIIGRHRRSRAPASEPKPPTFRERAVFVTVVALVAIWLVWDHLGAR